jgi:ATP-dependent exoDNAse (exonuclease V) beta subunit
LSAAADSAAAPRLPTPEQEAAISVSDRDVLLEAGAGTGKTGVMVERYCRLACDDGVSPDSILAFTFTDKAAAELRQRIRTELERRASTGSERARELLAQIGGAWITTIHGFCNRLLSGHPVAAGIDPDFRILDAPEAERAAREAFDEALGDLLGSGGDAAADLVATYEVDGLRAMVGGVHAELRGRGVAEPSLPAQPPPDVESALGGVVAAANEAIAELKPEDPKREQLEGAATLLSAGEPLSLDQLCALHTGSKARSVAPYEKAVEAAIARCAEAGEGGEAYRQIGLLLELFSGRFAIAKERRAGVDFEDLQILAADLLERSEIGESYRSRFSHLMVDEFQDTNRLQLRLIEALRGPGSELIAVGDELQSIYGFRNADLDVFREQRRRIAAQPRGETMELSGNFRSRPAVIGAVNALGEALLGASFRPLRVGTAPAEQDGEAAAVELLLTARDGWDEDEVELAPAIDDRTPVNCLAEARFLAQRLRTLADAGVERGEMVVLLRAFTHLDAYEDSLERAGLRPYVVGGRGYWSQQQVADTCALLATIANPLDDQALLGALASPACALQPDTLWLLRAAAGKRRQIWPAIERAVLDGEAELAAEERLAQIQPTELGLLRGFAETLVGLRERAGRISLAGLIEATVSATGYDLAILTRAAGEARFANVRKLMRLAEEFESREGRDLRGFLDFLASRAEANSEAQAATALEGHDGVRIMTVHNAKGLEFGVVAVPDLARSMLAGSRLPLLALGREPEPRVGMQLRRLGAGAINLFSYAELCEEAKQRDAEEGLRLFHVAATRARDHLILSGVVRPQAGNEIKPATAVIERIVAGLGIDRENDSTQPVPAPEARPGLGETFDSSQIAVRVNHPSPQRASELALIHREPADRRTAPSGPAPLLDRDPPAVPQRPLSYSAIAAFEECPYRFYTERVLGLGEQSRTSEPAAEAGTEPAAREGGSKQGERAARGAAVHSLLEWSAANGWREPSAELTRDHALAAGLPAAAEEDLLASLRGWLRSDLLAERVLGHELTVHAEAPLLLGIAGTVVRGSIDLLVERAGDPPLVIDYKTDRLGGASPADRVGRYETQRDIYALAVAEARDADEVEVAYAFLERPEQPVVVKLGPAEIEASRVRLEGIIGRIESGRFPPAEPERRDWDLCRGCPALGRTCSGPPS